MESTGSALGLVNKLGDDDDGSSTREREIKS